MKQDQFAEMSCARDFAQTCSHWTVLCTQKLYHRLMNIDWYV